MDDENNDPDYNFLDKQEEDHDTEDYRTDRAVKVSSKGPYHYWSMLDNVLSGE